MQSFSCDFMGTNKCGCFTNKKLIEVDTPNGKWLTQEPKVSVENICFDCKELLSKKILNVAEKGE